MESLLSNLSGEQAGLRPGRSSVEQIQDDQKKKKKKKAELTKSLLTPEMLFSFKQKFY